MRTVLRQFGRAPARILVSIFALALAIGAIGVFAIPSISEGSIHAIAADDGLADIMLVTTPIDDGVADKISSIDGVASVNRELELGAIFDGERRTAFVGLEFDDQQMDLIGLEVGRLPQTEGEVVVSNGFAEVGDVLTLTDPIDRGAQLSVVGVGNTIWWADGNVVFGELGDVTALSEAGGANRIVITASDDNIESLRSITDDVRVVLTDAGGRFVDFPIYLPDGTTPIDSDIQQISTLIGLLGVVAGLVALVLLASTTNTLITERTREVAVMRALGARSRPLRRRLRRIAVGITAIALLIGLPLGVLISNLIARMVLQEFVGITPDIGVNVVVLVASAVGALLGARLVAARAARRVTKLPLATALRDREGSPFGRRWSERLMASAPFGNLSTRIAVRSASHRRARSIAVVAQIAAGVGAAITIASLTTSVNEFNTATRNSWTWESVTYARAHGLPFDGAIVDGDPDSEVGIEVDGAVADWDIEVYGIIPSSQFIDPDLREGRWIEPGAHEAVLSAGFAERNGLVVGDMVDVELASGVAPYRIVGTADDFNRAVYVDHGDLSSDLGSPGAANVVWSSNDDVAAAFPVSTSTSTITGINEEDGQGRDAIVLIFGAIGFVVAGVAALAVISTMGVNLYERRHEFAALQAIGARRRRLRSLVTRELIPLGTAGIGLGVIAGYFGNRAIIGSFEASNSLDIGAVYAVGAVPFVIVGTVVGLLLLAAVSVRGTSRRPVAITLRGAA